MKTRVKLFSIICVLAISLSAISISGAAEKISELTKSISQDTQNNSETNLQDKKDNNGNLQSITKPLITKSSGGQDVQTEFYKSKRSREQTSLEDDAYKLSDEELLELLHSGYSIKDILKADELANTYYIDHKTLLEKKRNSNKDWDSVLRDIEEDRASSRLNKLKADFPDEYIVAQEAGLQPGEIKLVLAVLQKYEDVSVEELINAMKSQDKKAVHTLLKSKKEKVADIPKDRLSQLGLTQSDIEGISLEEFQQFEKVSKNMKVTVKDLIEKRNKMKKSASKGGK